MGLLKDVKNGINWLYYHFSQLLYKKPTTKSIYRTLWVKNKMQTKSESYRAKIISYTGKAIAAMTAWLNAQVNTCRVSCSLTDAARRLLRSPQFDALMDMNIAFFTSDMMFYRRENAVKLCIVQGQQTMIYHADFRANNPESFVYLEQVASQAGWHLLEDRRKVAHQVEHDRRQRVVIASIRLAASSFLLHNASVMASEFGTSSGASGSRTAFAASNFNDSTIVRPLGLFSSSTDYFVHEGEPLDLDEHDHADDDDHLHQHTDAITTNEFSPERYQSVLKVLGKKWIKNKRDPGYLADDIDEMAQYIAARPQAYELLMSVRKQPWTLHHKFGEFRSDVRGSNFDVNSVRIYFDTRAAAILKSHEACEIDARHCTASPVDALLHELLHAKLTLTETDEFIRSGGMSGAMYPYQHERKVIALENKMYRAMSDHDQQPRPNRRSHVGTLITADCATCVGG